MSSLASLQAFWGKSRDAGRCHNEPSVSKRATPALYKPIVHHLFDVAAVSLVWQTACPARLRRDSELLHVEPGHLAATVAFLSGLHDLGKISRSFQGRRPDLWPVGVLGPLSMCPERSHWRNTAILLRSEPIAHELSTLFPGLEWADQGRMVIAAVAGHHGRPPGHRDMNSMADARRDPELGPACVETAKVAFDALADLVGPRSLAGLRESRAIDAWSWRLSGLITLADWIGSDSAFFGFQPIEMPLSDYWSWAKAQAGEALRAKGLVPPPAFQAPSLHRVSPEAAKRPRPMQRLAERVPLAHGPQLLIIEETTGAGKTEAALMLAARMMAAGKGEGLFFALPTMATANAMYDRLATVYRHLYAEGAEPSLVLAHGRASLSDHFAATIGAMMSNGGTGETAAAFCTRWLADSRKKAFLADVGAATIDQAFLAILEKKHLTLRQFALAGRILVIDEAHSFDAYMNEELFALLQLQAMGGGSVIVLSATLTQKQKRRMAAAFGEGLGLRDAEDLGDDLRSQDYPLLTRVTRGAVREQAPGFDPALRRSVAIERLDDREAAVGRALGAAEQGAAVAVICNAVDEAIEVHAALCGTLDDRAHLFHARFAQGDRQRIEEDMLARFGRKASVEGRGGHVLVATQVIEQSLDLDFDLMISDLAPIDLLIQRAGRLWRHMGERPLEARAVDGPRLLVVSPDPDDVRDDTWLDAVLGKAAFVYRPIGNVWRTAREIFPAGKIETPDSFRPMIESVYREDGWSDVPEALRAKNMQADGVAAGEGSLGRMNVVDLAGGYGGLSDQLGIDEDIGTRLGEPTVTIRLARREGDRLVPWAATNDPSMAWALSELRLRRTWLPAGFAVADDAVRRAAKATWPDWEQSMPIGVVAEDGTVSFGSEGSDLTYDVETGLKKRSPP